MNFEPSNEIRREEKLDSDHKQASTRQFHPKNPLTQEDINWMTAFMEKVQSFCILKRRCSHENLEMFLNAKNKNFPQYTQREFFKALQISRHIECPPNLKFLMLSFNYNQHHNIFTKLFTWLSLDTEVKKQLLTYIMSTENTEKIESFLNIYKAVNNSALEPSSTASTSTLMASSSRIKSTPKSKKPGKKKLGSKKSGKRKLVELETPRDTRRTLERKKQRKAKQSTVNLAVPHVPPPNSPLENLLSFLASSQLSLTVPYSSQQGKKISQMAGQLPPALSILEQMAQGAKSTAPPNSHPLVIRPRATHAPRAPTPLSKKKKDPLGDITLTPEQQTELYRRQRKHEDKLKKLKAARGKKSREQKRGNLQIPLALPHFPGQPILIPVAEGKISNTSSASGPTSPAIQVSTRSAFRPITPHASLTPTPATLITSIRSRGPHPLGSSNTPPPDSTNSTKNSDITPAPQQKDLTKSPK